jgi:hypothetical protein
LTDCLDFYCAELEILRLEAGVEIGEELTLSVSILQHGEYLERIDLFALLG